MSTGIPSTSNKVFTTTEYITSDEDSDKGTIKSMDVALGGNKSTDDGVFTSDITRNKNSATAHSISTSSDDKRFLQCTRKKKLGNQKL